MCQEAVCAEIVFWRQAGRGGHLDGSILTQIQVLTVVAGLAEHVLEHQRQTWLLHITTFGIVTKVLAKCMLKYDGISLRCGTQLFDVHAQNTMLYLLGQKVGNSSQPFVRTEVATCKLQAAMGFDTAIEAAVELLARKPSHAE